MAFLAAQGRVIEVALPLREFPVKSAGEFDPVAWIRQAIYAGLDPMVWLPQDGKCYLYCSALDLKCYLAPPLATGDELGQIIDELMRMGRWETVGSPHPASASSPV